MICDNPKCWLNDYPAQRNLNYYRVIKPESAHTGLITDEATSYDYTYIDGKRFVYHNPGSGDFYLCDVCHSAVQKVINDH